MADGRAEVILSRLVDLAMLANFSIDRFTDVGEALGRGQSLVIPSIGDLTVYDDGSVPRTAGSRNDSLGTTDLTLTVDQEPWIPILMPAVDKMQNLMGNWESEISSQALIRLRVHIDELILDDYLTGEVAWLASGDPTYHYNLAADTLSAADLLAARGMALRNRGGGSLLGNLMFFLDPLAASAVMGFTGWQQLPASNEFGPQTIGRIFGIPVVETQGLRIQKEWPIATAALASNVLTLTFATNPGLVVGQQVSTDNLQTGYDLDSVSAATVAANGLTATFAKSAADDADVSGVDDVIIMDSAQNLLCDVRHVYKAVQKSPSVRIVNDPDTTGDIMQVSSLLGYKARAGRTWVIHSPPDSI